MGSVSHRLPHKEPNCADKSMKSTRCKSNNMGEKKIVLHPVGYWWWWWWGLGAQQHPAHSEPMGAGWLKSRALVVWSSAAGAGGEASWADAQGQEISARYSWAYLNAQLGLGNQPPWEGLDCLPFLGCPRCEALSSYGHTYCTPVWGPEAILECLGALGKYSREALQPALITTLYTVYAFTV